MANSLGSQGPINPNRSIQKPLPPIPQPSTQKPSTLSNGGTVSSPVSPPLQQVAASTNRRSVSLRETQYQTDHQLPGTHTLDPNPSPEIYRELSNSPTKEQRTMQFQKPLPAIPQQTASAPPPRPTRPPPSSPPGRRNVSPAQPIPSIPHSPPIVISDTATARPAVFQPHQSVLQDQRPLPKAPDSEYAPVKPKPPSTSLNDARIGTLKADIATLQKELNASQSRMGRIRAVLTRKNVDTSGHADKIVAKKNEIRNLTMPEVVVLQVKGRRLSNIAPAELSKLKEELASLKETLTTAERSTRARDLKEEVDYQLIQVEAELRRASSQANPEDIPQAPEPFPEPPPTIDTPKEFTHQPVNTSKPPQNLTPLRTMNFNQLHDQVVLARKHDQYDEALHAHIRQRIASMEKDQDWLKESVNAQNALSQLKNDEKALTNLKLGSHLEPQILAEKQAAEARLAEEKRRLGRSRGRSQ